MPDSRAKPYERPVYRPLLIGVTLLVWTTLALRLHLGAELARAQDQHALMGVLASFQNFTLTSTLLAALALASRCTDRGGRWLGGAGFNTLVAASLIMVALVYTLALRDLWQPTGLRKWVDVALHDLIPPVFLLYWWFSVPAVTLTLRSVLWWFLYPLGYLMVYFVKGGLTGVYPYPFFHPGELGVLRVIANATALVGLLALLTGLLVGVKLWWRPGSSGETDHG